MSLWNSVVTEGRSDVLKSMLPQGPILVTSAERGDQERMSQG